MQLEVISHHPENRTRTTPVLFVHGAWHAAWCWENFLPYFAQHGYSVYALSLRGHGGSEGREGIRWHSAARDYVTDLANIVKTFSTPPVIVGHSMGGYVLQKYLEKNDAAAGILLATIPVSGMFRAILRIILRHPWLYLKATVRMNSQILINTSALAKKAFFSEEMPDEDLQLHFARLQPESFRMGIETIINLPKPHLIRTPMLVLAAENDSILTVSEQQATGRAYGTKTEVFPNMSHDMMLEANWHSVANRIISWLDEKGTC